ncbi:MAG: hypothetical protein SGPRY_010315, partial [Prymnesium sp.]
AAKDETLSTNSETEAQYKARMDAFVTDMAVSPLPTSDVHAADESHADIRSHKRADCF